MQNSKDKFSKIVTCVTLLLHFGAYSTLVSAGVERDQAKRIHDRLVGTQASD
jgi:hypothetical protein